MRCLRHLPAILVVVAIMAHVRSGSAASLNSALASGSDSSWDDPLDEPSVVIGPGDFNRDGILDVVEVIKPDGEASGQTFLTVLLGKPDGTFTTASSQKLVRGDARALIVGDFNKDGNPDVIVGDAGGSLEEFFGDGHGQLTEGGVIATVGSVVSIAAGHFTHDGNLDLAVSDSGSNSVAIFLGAGNGSFQLKWSFQLPRLGRQFHLATADFNKDGVSDLVITSDDSDDYEVMLGNGNGTFTSSPELSHVRDPASYCPT